MKKLQKKLKVTLLSTAMAVALGAASMQMVQANNPDSVMLDASSMSYTSNGHIVLSVAGPEMDVVSTSSKSGSINWNLPANAKDGLYRYELKITALSVISAEAEGSDEEPIKAQRIHGSFVVANGQITTVGSENNAPDIPHFDEHSSLAPPSILKQVAISALDFLMPAAHAADLSTSPDGDIILEDDSPGILFRRDPNTGTASFVNQWILKVDDTAGLQLDDFVLYDDTLNRNVLIVRDGTPYRQYWGSTFYEVQNMDNANAPVIRIDKTNSENSMIVGSGGNVRLGNNTVFVDKINTRFGVGTTTPGTALHVAGTGLIRQEGPGVENWTLGAEFGDYLLKFDNGTNSTKVMTVENDDGACEGAGGVEIAPCVGFFEAGHIAGVLNHHKLHP